MSVDLTRWVYKTLYARFERTQQKREIDTSDHEVRGVWCVNLKDVEPWYKEIWSKLSLSDSSDDSDNSSMLSSEEWDDPDSLQYSDDSDS